MKLGSLLDALPHTGGHSLEAQTDPEGIKNVDVETQKHWLQVLQYRNSFTPQGEHVLT